MATVVAEESYAFDQGFGLMQDSFFSLVLAAPFIAMSLMAYATRNHSAAATRGGRPGSALRSVRVRLILMLPILLFGVVASGGRHFDRMEGANPVTRVSVPVADSGVPVSVVAWLLALGVALGARRPPVLTSAETAGVQE